jgi:hypothetical protein
VFLECSKQSWDATHKAFGTWYFKPSPTEPGILVFAIRGTKTRRDHTVNLNSDGLEAGAFIVSV